MASFSVEIYINAPVESVFAYVSDLTRHPEWADNPLEITPVEAGSPAQGSRYRSLAHSHGVDFQSELVVTSFDPPTRFGFDGSDTGGAFSHDFMLKSSKNGTVLKRKITVKTTPMQWLFFMITLTPVRLPSAKRSLRRLKDRLEKSNA